MMMIQFFANGRLLVVLLLSHQISISSSWISTPKSLLHAPVRKRLASSDYHDASLMASTQHQDTGTPPSISTSTFGKLCPILLPGQSQLGAMGVPTFAAIDPFLDSSVISEEDHTKCRGLEGILNQGPAMMVDNVLTPQACQAIIKDCDNAIGFGNYNQGKNHHGALQVLVSQKLCDKVAKKLAPHIDIKEVESLRQDMIRATTSGQQEETEDVRLVFSGLNRRWRIYRYQPNGKETFAPHIDAGFKPSGLSEDGSTLLWDSSDPDSEEVVSRLTVLMYLNDDFMGGETVFYQPANMQYGSNGVSNPKLIGSVRPVTGSCLLFPQGVGEDAVEYARQYWPLHEGSPVLSGQPKYVIRSDVLFVTQKQPLALHDEMFRYDHLVRQTFLPTSNGTINKNFLGHTMSLYNPHMGVENLGALLYSFIRFTKKRKIVEIGAGYTSLWILQALKENDEELERIRLLDKEDRCRLLNYPWTAQHILQNYDSEPASLLFIDNCEHQKETATGAGAVAKSLGLDSYMQFLKGDAFELELESNSIDILWCDFGVGSRMSDFASSAWKSICPGGFLLCHSTLTNESTRNWLEAVRARSSQDITGIPPDEYVELSLLEPHKGFQNSITVIQKRKSMETGTFYEEPLYSKFA